MLSYFTLRVRRAHFSLAAMGNYIWLVLYRRCSPRTIAGVQTAVQRLPFAYMAGFVVMVSCN